MNVRQLCLTHWNYWCRHKPPNCTEQGHALHPIKFNTYQTRWIVWVPNCHFMTSTWGRDLANLISEVTHVQLERMEYQDNLIPAITTIQTRYYVVREYLRQHTEFRKWVRTRERCPVCNRAYFHHAYYEYRSGFERGWYGDDTRKHYCRSALEEKKCTGPSLFELRETQRIIRERKIRWLTYHQEIIKKVQKALRSENPREALKLLRKVYGRRGTSLR